MNILKINGQALEGIYVDAAISFNKPAKRVSTYSVPGRNGDLVIDEGTFDNVLITYPVFEKSTFPTEFDAIVNYLASLEGYQRIECSNDPQHYRLGRFVVPQNPTAKRLNRDGYWQLSFDCKPQRWLLSGEEDTEIDANPIDEYSGDIVSFNAVALDEITELKAAIEPVQDLNGQTSPYPAGGGKNKWSFNASYQSASSGTLISLQPFVLAAGNYAISMRGSLGAAMAVTFRDSSNNIIKTVTISGSNFVNNYYSTSFTLDSASAVINVYSSGAYDLSQIQIESGSTATPYAPYSNICPISGHTEVNVTRTGKNICPISGGVNNTVLCAVKSGQTYTFSLNAANKCGFNLKKNSNSGALVANYGIAVGRVSVTFTANEDFDLFLNGYSHTTGVTFANSVTDFQLELGSTPTTYEPYAGQTYPTTLGQTVYGGTLNVTTGVLTITHLSLALNGTETWRASASTPHYNFLSQNDNNSLHLERFKVYGDGTGYAGRVGCSHYKGVPYATGADLPDMSTTSYSGQYGKSIGVKDSNIADASAMQAYCLAQYNASTPVTFILALITPTTVQLTAAEVELLLGQNNIWADTGDVEVKVTTPTVFNNPSLFNSKPLIRVYGIGTFRVNDITVTIASHDKPYIDIDCELQECYYGSENMNEYVSFSGNDFPELQPGDDYMLLASGITKLVVTPRWWIL